MNHTIKLLGGATAGCTVLFIGYDYQTCHPMRKMMGYNVDGAYIRFHNIIKMSFISTNKIMSLQDLSQYDGGSSSTSTDEKKKQKKPIYFSSQGWIWDASTSETFRDTYGQWAGKDATVALAKMSMDKNDINRTDCWKNLSSKEMESLQSWTNYFMEKYMIKGIVKEYFDDDIEK